MRHRLPSSGCQSWPMVGSLCNARTRRSSWLYLPAEEYDFAAIPNSDTAFGETASCIKSDVTHALAGHSVDAGSADLTGMISESLDQSRANAAAAKFSRKIDMQVGGKTSGEVDEVRAEVADIGKSVLLGGILKRPYEIA